MSENAPAKKTSLVQSILLNIPAFALAFLLVFAIRSSLIEPFKIPSGSMIPTLLIGDHIFVNKLAYGVKVPFSDWFGKPIHIVDRDPAKRGDIVVFIYPKDPSLHYIKRVIGVPGDRIEIKNKALYINDQIIPRAALDEKDAQEILKGLDDQKYAANSLELYNEQLDGHPHPIMLNKETFLGESFGPVTVPEKSLFVMGDNRDFSNDSRFWGFVPFDNVKGKAMFVWLSLWIVIDDQQVIFRPERIGTVLK